MGIYEHQRALLALYREILTERQFEMIRMHDVDGMSGRQIADVYGLGRSSVCRIMKEARLAIRNAARREKRMEDKKLKWVYICSPLRGDYKANTEAAIEHCREVALEDDTVPIAPHIYCPRFLLDTELTERRRGMAIGIEMLEMCDEVRVYGDRISEGMQAEISRAKELGIPVHYV